MLGHRAALALAVISAASVRAQDHHHDHQHQHDGRERPSTSAGGRCDSSLFWKVTCDGDENDVGTMTATFYHSHDCDASDEVMRGGNPVRRNITMADFNDEVQSDGCFLPGTHDADGFRNKAVKYVCDSATRRLMMLHYDNQNQDCNSQPAGEKRFGDMPNHPRTRYGQCLCVPELSKPIDLRCTSCGGSDENCKISDMCFQDEDSGDKCGWSQPSPRKQYWLGDAFPLPGETVGEECECRAASVSSSGAAYHQYTCSSSANGSHLDKVIKTVYTNPPSGVDPCDASTVAQKNPLTSRDGQAGDDITELDIVEAGGSDEGWVPTELAREGASCIKNRAGTPDADVWSRWECVDEKTIRLAKYRDDDCAGTPFSHRDYLGNDACVCTRANADNDINNMLNAMMQGGGAENDRRCKKGSTDFGGFDDPATVQRLAHHNVTDDGEKVFFMHIYEAGCRMECTAELPLVADGECHRGGQTEQNGQGLSPDGYYMVSCHGTDGPVMDQRLEIKLGCTAGCEGQCDYQASAELCDFRDWTNPSDDNPEGECRNFGGELEFELYHAARKLCFEKDPTELCEEGPLQIIMYAGIGILSVILLFVCISNVCCRKREAKVVVVERPSQQQQQQQAAPVIVASQPVVVASQPVAQPVAQPAAGAAVIVANPAVVVPSQPIAAAGPAIVASTPVVVASTPVQ